MKDALQKRFDSVKGLLEKACQEFASGQSGILGLHNLQRAQEEAGRLVFDMVMNGEGSVDELRQLVSHEVMLQTIFASWDHKSAIMSRINQDKSRAEMRERIQLLYDWLDLNIHKYVRRLDHCAEEAAQNIPDLHMTAGTVKKHITLYRKLKGLADGKSSEKSKKKRK